MTFIITCPLLLSADTPLFSTTCSEAVVRQDVGHPPLAESARVVIDLAGSFNGSPNL